MPACRGGSTEPILGYRRVRFGDGPSVPLDDNESAASRVFLPKLIRAQKKKSMISIVEDDVAVREATRALVRSLGHRAAAFASAEEFLSSDRLHETSCVITDVQMPGMTGIELQ